MGFCFLLLNYLCNLLFVESGGVELVVLGFFCLVEAESALIIEILDIK